MKAKFLFLCIAMVLITSLLCGCANTGTVSPSPSPSPSMSPSASGDTSPGASQTTADSVSSASLVNTPDAFELAIGPNGVWIVCLLEDITVDKDLVVDGDFMNTKDPPASQRKLAFYAQDENRTITDRYTLTAPTLTIKSPDCAIWNGTFRGDLYVDAENFQLVGATVDGDVYFTSDAVKASFTMDENSAITGVQTIM